MTIQNTNVPTLRFPEFNENWEKKKLGEYLTFKNGINADKSQYGKGAKFINVLDIINNNTITHDKIIGKVEVSENELKKNEVKYGDILFQRSSETREEVGQSNVYVDETQTATFGGFVIRGQAIQKYNPLFFHYLLKTSSAREEITTKSGGSTRYNIGQETLKEVKIIVPKIPEQEKISTFLTTIDEKIQKISKKKILLEQYKKGVIQKIFNQEIRFKDSDGNDFADWEEKKLGELGNLVGGGTPSKNKQSYWSGEIPWISSSDLTNGNIRKINLERFINKHSIENSATQLIPENSVLIVSRVGVGKVAVNEKPLCTSQDFQSLIPEKDNSIYLAYLIQIKTNELLSYNQGTSIKGFTKDNLRSLKIGVPTIAEQQIIADFLSAIDEKINFVNVQLVKTQNYKQGLLQQMFL